MRMFRQALLFLTDWQWILGLSSSYLPPATEEDVLVKFIGGPLDGEWLEVPEDCPAITYDPGEYTPAMLGFDGRVYERVMVWSGCHDNELLDIILGTEEEWPCL